ncbi:ankyrin repeat domain-containing protein [Paracidovorax oryzae]|uniref:ankyrin repeat domain-containing protein n=1 Tax=Paracidovorax oryzae TaxID=862720 RepID=UPI0002EE79ED|nr:ankyrin repeat domain-containing protein [Paracidovorax oryzae]
MTQFRHLSRRLFVSAAALAGAGLCAACAHAGAYDDFFTAIVRDQGDDITALVRRGFDPNTRNPKGDVGLTLALQQGSMKAFDALMAAPGIKVETRNSKDESPLMIACLRGQVAAVRALIAKDGDVNKTGWTPLHYAASGTTDQQLEITRLLIDQSAYIDAESPNGTTPLMMAVSYGRADVARFLVEQGADPTIKNQLGLTAADFARRAARQDMVDLVAQALQRRQPNRGKW